MMNKYNNAHLWALVLVGGLSGTMHSLVATGIAPTIDPSGTEVYSVVSAIKLKLTASEGTAETPSDTCECPPWAEKDTFTYKWSDGTTGAIKEVDISSSGDKGEFSVQGVGQVWEDQAGTPASAPTDTPNSDAIHVHAVEIKFEQDMYQVEDGEPVSIEITVDEEYLNKITDGVLTIEPKAGSGTSLSPGGVSTVQKQSSDFEWNVPHAYWLDDNCVMVSRYALKFTFKLNGISEEITSELRVNGLKAGGTLGHSGGECVYEKLYIKGRPETEVGYNSQLKKVVVWVKDEGDLERVCDATPSVFNRSDSQFHAMIVQEEGEHEKQMEGLRGESLDPSAGCYEVADLYNSVKNVKGYSSAWSGTFAPGGAQFEAMQLEAANAFNAEYASRRQDYLFDQGVVMAVSEDEKRPAMEAAAKNYAGSDYILSIGCAY